MVNTEKPFTLAYMNNQHTTPMSAQTVSIVIPAYNEEEVLPHFHERLVDTLSHLEQGIEIVYINDGSSDRTLVLLNALQTADDRITIINLSRNFGKEIALTAGLDFACGDAAVVIDADLQDPPELIPALIRHWRDGFDVVYAKRTRRLGESRLKKASSYLFYRLMNQLADEPIPEDTGDFRLIDRKALDALASMRERHRYMKGLFAWIGFSQKAVEYERDPRYAGHTKWSFLKLLGLAAEGLTSFSMAPLRLASMLGLFTALIGFGYGTMIILKKLLLGDAVQGFPSLVALVALIGGVQLLAIGIIGEYIGRIFNETKNRPLYFVQNVQPSQPLRDSGRLAGMGPHCPIDDKAS